MCSCDVHLKQRGLILKCSEPVEEECRVSKIRLDPGTRSKAPPPVRAGPDRRPPLRRRRRAQEDVVTGGERSPSPRPIVLREPVDERPPLERRKRQTAILLPRQDEEAGAVNQEVQCSRPGGDERTSQPLLAGNDPGTDSGVVPAPSAARQCVEPQTMSDEQYERLANKRKKILQAVAEKQLQVQQARQSIGENLRHLSGAASSSQAQVHSSQQCDNRSDLCCISGDVSLSEDNRWP